MRKYGKAVKGKKSARKMWESPGRDQSRLEHRELSLHDRESSGAEEKEKAYSELDERPDTKEGENGS